MANTRKSAGNIAGYAILAASFLVLFYYQYRLRNFTWDDSYITYRHALNMARGFGPVYNPGELADGITNYLLAWILSIGIRLHVDPLMFSKLLGIISAWGVLLFAWFFARIRMRMSYIFAGIAVFLLACNGMVAVESVGGLETSLFTLLVFWVLWEVTRTRGNELSIKNLGIAGILSGVAMLLRPDAAFFIAAVIVLLIDRKDFKGSAKRIAIYLLPILVIFLPYFIRHWMLFGYPFPNSYYAKKLATVNLLSRGFQRLATNLSDLGIFIMFYLFFVSSIRGIKYILNKEHDNSTRYKGLLLFILARMIFIILSGGSWMGWGRFIVPVIPLIYLFIIGLVDEVWHDIARVIFIRFSFYFLIILLVVNNFLATNINLFREANPSLHLDRVHIPLGLALKDTLAPDDSICFGDAGALPYYADVINIDPAGLCDRHIAHLPGEFDVKTDPEYILNRHPVLIILNSIDPYPQFNPQSPIDKAIVSYPRLKQEYTFILAFEAWDSYNLWLFARKDRAAELKASLMRDPHLIKIFNSQ